MFESFIRIWLPWIAAMIVGILCASQLEAKIKYYGGSAVTNPGSRYYAPGGQVGINWIGRSTLKSETRDGLTQPLPSVSRQFGQQPTLPLRETSDLRPVP